MMFPKLLPLPRTSLSSGTGDECFFAHAGSAPMASGLSAGAFPSKVMVPLTVEAATAMPGQSDTATSPATTHNLFPVARMLGSLVIAKLVSGVTVDAPAVLPGLGRLYTAARRPCNTLTHELANSRWPAARG